MNKPTWLIYLFLILSMFFTKRADGQPNSDFSPPTTILVAVHPLNSQGGVKSENLCSQGDMHYGCTASDIYGGYPYATNPVEVNINSDYLLDIVSHEIGVDFDTPLSALEAQVIASRTFAYNLHHFGLEITNGADSAQIFLPYAYENEGSQH